MSRGSRAVVHAALLCAAACAACGYSSVRAPATPGSLYCVGGSEAPAADPHTRAALEDGVRVALARRRALGACNTSTRLVVRLLRAESTPVGLVAGSGSDVLARGERVRVEASAHAYGPNGADVSYWAEGEVTMAHGASPLLHAIGQRRARAEAARRCGAALAARILGEPTPLPAH